MKKVVKALKKESSSHDDVIKSKHFRVTGFLRGIHWSPLDSPHKDQWRGTLMFSLICAWTNGCANNRDVGDLNAIALFYVTLMILTFNTLPTEGLLTPYRIYMHTKDGWVPVPYIGPDSHVFFYKYDTACQKRCSIIYGFKICKLWSHMAGTATAHVRSATLISFRPSLFTCRWSHVMKNKEVFLLYVIIFQ